VRASSELSYFLYAKMSTKNRGLYIFGSEKLHHFTSSHFTATLFEIATDYTKSVYRWKFCSQSLVQAGLNLARAGGLSNGFRDILPQTSRT